MHRGLDLHSRIVPALFFQPHFSDVNFTLQTDEKETAALLESNQLEEIGRSPIFNQFKYIKTFAPSAPHHHKLMEQPFATWPGQIEEQEEDSG